MLKEGGKYDPHDYSYDYPPLAQQGLEAARRYSMSTIVTCSVSGVLGGTAPLP